MGAAVIVALKLPSTTVVIADIVDVVEVDDDVVSAATELLDPGDELLVVGLKLKLTVVFVNDCACVRAVSARAAKAAIPDLIVVASASASVFSKTTVGVHT